MSHEVTFSFHRQKVKSQFVTERPTYRRSLWCRWDAAAWLRRGLQAVRRRVEEPTWRQATGLPPGHRRRTDLFRGEETRRPGCVGDGKRRTSESDAEAGDRKAARPSSTIFVLMTKGHLHLTGTERLPKSCSCRRSTETVFSQQLRQRRWGFCLTQSVFGVDCVDGDGGLMTFRSTTRGRDRRWTFTKWIGGDEVMRRLQSWMTCCLLCIWNCFSWPSGGLFEE